MLLRCPVCAATRFGFIRGVGPSCLPVVRVCQRPASTPHRAVPLTDWARYKDVPLLKALLNRNLAAPPPYGGAYPPSPAYGAYGAYGGYFPYTVVVPTGDPRGTTFENVRLCMHQPFTPQSSHLALPCVPTPAYLGT